LNDVPKGPKGKYGEGPLNKLSDELLNRARRRLIKMHYDAKVGHLGGNLSCIDVLMLVYHELLKSDDRFILSKGHSVGALYVTLWTLNKLSEVELESFHTDGTRLPGHPPARGIREILFATGSLGHGLSLAAGLALAGRFQKSDREVYCLTSDGEWQEGSTLEAAIFSAHHRLSKLTIFVDHNSWQGFGSTKSVASMDPLQERLAGLALDIHVCNGHDLDEMRRALLIRNEQPRLIILNTIKGKGIQELADRLESHYLPLTDAQYYSAIAS
jgi:transketolase